MSEATVRCPKCGHKGIMVTNLLNSDLRLIADSQAAEIERLQSELDECRRLLREVCRDPERVEVDGVRCWEIITADEWMQAARAAGGEG